MRRHERDLNRKAPGHAIPVILRSTFPFTMPLSGGMKPRRGWSNPRVGRSLGAALVLLLAGCSPKTAPHKPGPPTVLVAPPKQEDTPIYDEFVGTLDGSVNASIEARVQGYLTSQDYKEGTAVKKDALLFQIDPRPFAAALAQAKAALAQAQAAQKQAELTAGRNVDLFNHKAISDQERDNAVQAAAAAKAQTDAQEAAVEQAQLNLDFTAIRSPVDGIAGLATAQVGDLVGPSTGVLTTVSKVNPIKAYFTISDQLYVNYTQRYNEIRPSAPRMKRNCSSSLSSRTARSILYRAISSPPQNQVDIRTGSVRIASHLPESWEHFATGRIRAGAGADGCAKRRAPCTQRAVIELQGSYQLALVGPDNKVHIQPVEVGRRIGDLWIITKGLKPNDRVVVEGVQKVREGAPVTAEPGRRRPAPVPARRTRARIPEANVEVFHRSADYRHRHRDLMAIIGAVAVIRLPIAQYPNIVPPNPGARDLSRGRRPDGRAIGSRADRAADERRG